MFFCFKTSIKFFSLQFGVKEKIKIFVSTGSTDKTQLNFYLGNFFSSSWSSESRSMLLSKAYIPAAANNPLDAFRHLIFFSNTQRSVNCSFVR
jgi:hypothetical protein